ncbi:MAG: hypothetical protein PHV45_04235, partial [Desulfuromonas thiophila]|nr:hypothetical protein [Desulfuromonas thiophila]
MAFGVFVLTGWLYRLYSVGPCFFTPQIVLRTAAVSATTSVVPVIRCQVKGIKMSLNDQLESMQTQARQAFDAAGDEAQLQA